MLDEERIEKGLKKLEKEAAKQEKKFREAFLTEEAHRLTVQVKELKEQLLEFKSKVNLESYIRYFYEDIVSMPQLLIQMAERNGRANAGPVIFLEEPARLKEQAEAVELEFRESMTQRAEKGLCAAGTDGFTLQRGADSSFPCRGKACNDFHHGRKGWLF